MSYRFNPMGRRTVYQNAKLLNEEGYCYEHKRRYATNRSRGGRIVPTGGCPQCQSGMLDALREARRDAKLRG